MPTFIVLVHAVNPFILSQKIYQSPPTEPLKISITLEIYVDYV